MNIFGAVKEQVSTRQAAAFYGIAVGHGGMALCPFHHERHPSMKIDRRFHCFGCQADGDVIDFVSRLHGVSVKEAALRLAADFGISYANQSAHPRQPLKAKREERRFADAEQRCFRELAAYLHLLERWKTEYAPKTMDEPWHPLFVEALENQLLIEEALDTLFCGRLREKAEIMIYYGRKVVQLERRLSEFAAQHSSDANERSGRDGAGVER